MHQKNIQEIIEKNAVLLCEKLHICTVDSFDQLPDVLKTYFSTFSHVEVCQWMVWSDKKDGASINQLQIKYCLTRRQVTHICHRLDKQAKDKKG